jgi:hypothetical protein
LASFDVFQVGLLALKEPTAREKSRKKNRVSAIFCGRQSSRAENPRISILPVGFLVGPSPERLAFINKIKMLLNLSTPLDSQVFSLFRGAYAVAKGLRQMNN